MTIAEVRQKCKDFFARFFPHASVPRDVLIIGVLVLASSFSFGLGYLAGVDAAGQEGDVTLESASLLLPVTAASATVGQVVASKNGTKYYLPSCTGVERITETNKVWFVSPAAAAAAGYTPAAN